MQQQMSDLTKKNQKGFVLLVAALLISAVAGTIGASLVLLGLNASRTSFAIEQSNQTKALANACAEEALQQIKDSIPFEGTGNITMGNGTCTYTVTKGTGQERTVTASGAVGNMTRKITISLDSITPDMNITSWQEVADL
jgi:uncharacterized protein (UPF0333 family)